MSADAPDLPEPDCAPGAAHPRETLRLYGQGRADGDFLGAFATGRLHHGWLITGPRGVGKATLAWRIARFLLSQADPGGLFAAPPPASLDTPPDHPVIRRSIALAEPRLFLLRRGPNEKGTALSADIRVDEVRRLKGFLQLSAVDGGRRVVIVDAADELNVQAANALLKLLEEPPAAVTFLLIAHQPARLLPTIRSRCRELRAATLEPADMAAALAQAGIEVQAPEALAALACGSVGAAMRITNLDGLDLYARLVGLMAAQPRFDRASALAFSDAAAGAANAARFDLVLDLFDLFLTRLARTGVAGAPFPEAAPGEAAAFARLALDASDARRWAELQQELGARARRGRAVNLDPAALVMDMVLHISAAAAA
ncbi:DNA polymerase III subunit delta' [Phaeovulum sp.]|uniref:DNA polymerase III subunit delta' n=1 Tax=Phaeovulum sp. TaxID=2934796 RepID=UPI002730B2DE|nr:DNA polymerase III subunit delta' [Phaeovulum sp.]MDP1670088.1 DNA polymerase III subunit delta' [Phaeovulum sp.]MDZ4118330.1 DNA polymerase III subunit delta' [Phaeovulum sp.]